MFAGLPAPLDLEYITAVAEQAAVEAQTVSDAWHGGAAIAKGPIARVYLVNPSPGTPAHVGRIAQCAVVHDCPAQELRTWIVGIAVIGEEVGQSEASRRDCVPVDRARTG